MTCFELQTFLWYSIERINCFNKPFKDMYVNQKRTLELKNWNVH